MKGITSFRSGADGFRMRRTNYFWTRRNCLM